MPESIIDASRPSPGRIYDYLLGGYHNFEVDRQAADQLKKMFPSLEKGMRLQRWCLQDLAMELTQKRGYDVIIDFASGLPTQDHIHYVVPTGTTVIYSDFDPVSVEYAQDILKDTPNVYYFEADARTPEELLHRPEVEAVLHGRRDVGFVYWGVSAYLSDEDILHAAQELYRWSGPHSTWAFNAQGAINLADSSMTQETRKIYEQAGSNMFFRSLERFAELLQPWCLDRKGFVSLFEWHGFDTNMLTPEEREFTGAGGGNFGAYLTKEVSRG